MENVERRSIEDAPVREKPSQYGIWRNICVPVLQALVVVVIIRTFIAQPFSIPSGSMMGTLLVGDNIFTTKYSYGYGRYSFPFDMSFDGRVFKTRPKRGDVIVFRLPRAPEVDYVKRLIGLPGDRIQVKRGMLYINDKAVERERMPGFVDDRKYANGAVRTIDRYRETLPNGTTYNILDVFPNGEVDNTQVYTVPPREYFFMGDNRDNSLDSRYSFQIGTVPEDNLVGKVQFIFFSMQSDTEAWEFWKWPQAIRWSRTFKSVD